MLNYFLNGFCSLHCNPNFIELFEECKSSWGLMCPRSESGNFLCHHVLLGKQKGRNSRRMVCICEAFYTALLNIDLIWFSQQPFELKGARSLPHFIEELISQLINVKEMIELEKSPFGNCNSNNYFRQEWSMDAKIIRWNSDKKQ